ncbi:PKD-like domain-containing protein [Filimonas effusa]|uniref:T9SS type B sorting domain-containing protein n=1 Tax=Filimonas effusa TaxID=2508721 RepID=A0A4Q1DB48_9BACT|nr:PKD-like domain-containing protein [Filimonas effusa]RXK86661.1 T9SS type B sorting domain-containing protein [Filimonas effusa]
MTPPISEKQTRARLLFTLLLVIAGFVPASAQTDTEFWFAVPHVIGDSRRDRPILLRMMAIDATLTSQVTISCPANPAFTPITTTINVGAVSSVDLTSFLEAIETSPPNTVLKRGLKITATRPITAYFDESSNLNPEIYALKGKNALGLSFFVPGQTTYSNNTGDSRDDRRAYNSFDIVATEDNTAITITPSKALYGGRPANQAFTIVLNKGEVFSCQAAGQNKLDHLGGSTVIADKPVAITMKDDFVGVSTCSDASGDQLVPVGLLGTEYISINGYFNDERACVMAIEDGTVVTTSNGVSKTLSKGQTYEFDYSGKPIYIKATKPISVLHLSGVGCELSSAVLPPLGSCIGSKVVGMVRPGGSECYLILLVPANIADVESSFRFNGSAGVITAGDFKTVTPQWLYARIPLNTTVFPANTSAKIESTLGVKFHAGLLYGKSGDGASYGYFSNYATSPVASPPKDTVFCNGQATGELKFSSTVNNSSFTWTNDNIAIGLSAGGAGDIPSFKAINNTDQDIIAHVTVVPTANDCVGPDRSFTITVHPTPKLKIAAIPDAVCAPATVDITIPAVTNGSTADLSFRYYTDAAGKNLVADPTKIATSGKYYLQGETKAGCVTDIQPVDVTVYPKPSLLITNPAAVCTPATVDLTAAAVTSGSAAGLVFHYYSDDKAATTLTTPSAVASQGTYYINATSKEGCTSDIMPVSVTINQPVVVTTDPAATSVCEAADAAFEVAATGTGPLVYQWQTDNGTGAFTDLAGATAAKLSLLAVTNDMNGYQYRVKVKGACGEKMSQAATLTVKPLPKLSGTTNVDVCSGESFSYTPSGLQTGTTYTWERLKVNNISNEAATGSNTGINETLKNTSNLVVPVTYTFQMKLAGCEQQQHFDVQVKPKPTVNLPVDQEVCANSNTNAVNFSGASLPVTTTYEWSNTSKDIGLAATGTGNIAAFRAKNETDQTVNATITVTPSSDGCKGESIAFDIKVKPLPYLSGTTGLSVCSGQEFTYTPAGLPTGTTYTWERKVAANISNSASTGNNTIKETLTNTSNSNVNVTYTFTMKLNGCENEESFTVLVRPKPSVDAPADQKLCHDTKISDIKFSGSLVSTTTYNWVATGDLIGLAAASGTGDIASFTVQNTSAIPATATITVTPSADNCSGDPESFKIVVNPIPDVTVPGDQLICYDEQSQKLEFSSNVTSAAFRWENDNTAIGLSSSGTGNIASFKATNSTNAAITGTVTVTPEAYACKGDAKSFKITVNPLLQLAGTTGLSVCSGVEFNYEPTGLPSGAGYTWERKEVAGISNGVATGSNAGIKEKLTNTGRSEVLVTYIFKLKLNGCEKEESFTVLVKPKPSVDLPANQELCHDTKTNDIKFSGPSVSAVTTYSWVASGDAVGLAATTGTGDIAAFNARNTGTILAEATITVTPSADNCNGEPEAFKIVVNPIPDVTVPADQLICYNEQSQKLEFSSSVTVATFRWENDNAGIGLPASGAGNIAPFIGTNGTNATITGTVTVIPEAYTCKGDAKTFKITVNPELKLSGVTNLSVCSGEEFTYEPSGLPSGAAYTWERKVVAGISNGVATGSNAGIKEKLTNTSRSEVLVTYVFKLKLNDCEKEESFTVLVKPKPSVDLPVDQELCHNSETRAINFSGAAVSKPTTYSWSAAGDAIGLATSGTGDIASFKARNTGTTPAEVTITVTPSADNCSGDPESFKIVVNPIPDVTVPGDQLICYDEQSQKLEFGSSVTVATFRWGNDNTGIGLPASGTGNIAPFKGINSTNTAITGTITVTPEAYTCKGDAKSFKITVSPLLQLAGTTGLSVCSGAEFSYEPTGLPSGASYTWERKEVAGISNGVATGSNAGIKEKLTNTSRSEVLVTYVFKLKLNGCEKEESFTVLIKPKPSVDLPAGQELCHNSDTKAINFSGASVSKPTTYSWSAVGADIGLAISGTGDIASFKARNAGTAPAEVTITVTPSADNCNGDAESFKIVVNPIPDVTVPGDQLICYNEQSQKLEFSSNVAVASFSWANDNTDIGLPASGTGNIAPFKGANSTNTEISGIVTVIPQAYNCKGDPKAFKITVNPQLQLAGTTGLSVCSGGEFTYEPTGLPSGTTYTWERKSVSDISNGTATGTGAIKEILTNTSRSEVLVTYVFKLKLNDCEKEESFTVLVKAKPSVDLPANQELCHDTKTNDIKFSGPSVSAVTTYSWVASGDAVGLAATTGTGDIAAFNARNTGTTPAEVTITVTPSADNCKGDPESFKIVVNPIPDVTVPGDQLICYDEQSQKLEFSSRVAAATFGWVNSNTGIGLPSSGMGDIASFKGMNSTNAAITGAITVTPEAYACKGDAKSFKITVNPLLQLAGTAGLSVCSGAEFSYEPSGLPAGASYTWERKEIAGISNGVATGSNAGIKEKLTNTSRSEVLVTYVFKLKLNDCEKEESFTVLIKPKPSVDLPAGQELCHNSDTKAINFSGAAVSKPTTYSWSATGDAIGLAASGIGDITSFKAQNTGTTPAEVTITVTPSADNCKGDPESFKIVVNPIPDVTVPGDQLICYDEQSQKLEFSSRVAAATFGWVNSNTGIGLPSSGMGDIASFKGMNSTNAAITGAITVTPEAYACKGDAKSFKITVNPLLQLAGTAGLSVCSGAEFSYEPTGLPSGASYTWERKEVAGISNGVASGSNACIKEKLTNTSRSEVLVTYVFKLKLSDCEKEESFTVLIKPKPSVDLPAGQEVCHNSDTKAINFSGAAVSKPTTYSWSAVGADIGLAISGTGDIASFKARNAGTAPAEVTITVTPSADNCNGDAESFKIVVNPIPDVTVPGDQLICYDEQSQKLEFSSRVAAATFGWVNSNTGIGLPSSGMGDIASFKGMNSTNAAITGAITVTPEAYACKGDAKSFKITVNPLLQLAGTAGLSVCSGAEFSYEPSGLPAGASYTWERKEIAGISNGVATGSNAGIKEKLTNTSRSEVLVTYVFKLKLNDCEKEESFTVLIKPKPSVDLPADQELCHNGDTKAISFSGAAVSKPTTYSWSTVGDAIGLATSGTGDIASFKAQNTGTTPAEVTITVTPSADNCKGDPESFKIVVNPIPDVTVPGDQLICYDEQSQKLEFSSNVTSAAFRWENDNTAIGLSSSGTGNIASFKATNSTNAAITGTVTVTPEAYACKGDAKSFKITVNPLLQLAGTTGLSVCSGAEFSYEPTGLPSDASYTWERKEIADISNGVASGSNAGIKEKLTNTGRSEVLVTYVFKLKLNGCEKEESFTVLVKQKPSVDLPADQELCHNGDTKAISFSGAAVSKPTTYSWSAVGADIGLATSGTGDIASFKARNAGTAPAEVTITVTPSADNCKGDPESFKIVVNPIPDVTVPGDQLICYDEQSQKLEFSSRVAAATFSWENSNTGIGLSASGKGDIAPFIGTNGTNATITGTVTVIPEAYTCKGDAKTFKITVNPELKLSGVTNLSVCSGVEFTYEPMGLPSGATYSWERKAVSDVSNGTATGSGAIKETLTNTSRSEVLVKYTFKLKLNDCEKEESFTVLVKPKPSVDLPVDQELCHNSETRAINFSGAAVSKPTTYSWSVAGDPIGLTTAGAGNIASFKAQNTSVTPAKAIITVTPSADNCNGEPQIFKIVVNPNPLAIMPANVVVCAGSGVPEQVLTTDVDIAKTSFEWKNDNKNIGLSESGIGNIGAFIATNDKTEALNALISVTPTAYGCTGKTGQFEIKVYPLPALTGTDNLEVCSGVQFSYKPTGLPSGTSYTWKRDKVPGIVNEAAGGKDDEITEALVNETGADVLVIYRFEMEANNCRSVKSFTVKVKPTPVLTSGNPPAICDSSYVVYTATSNVPAADIKWIRSGMTTETKGAKIDEFIKLGKSTVQQLVYTYTLLSDGCVHKEDVTVDVNPKPYLISGKPPVICDDNTFSYTPVSNVKDVDFTWKRQGVSGTGSISEQVLLHNTKVEKLTYQYALTAGACTNEADVVLEVHPKPVLTSALKPTAICDNSNFNYTATSDVNNVDYKWTRTPGNSSASTNVINEVLKNNTTASLDYTYQFLLDANGCTNTQDVVVAVKPSPRVDLPANQEICANSNTVAVVFSGTPVAGTATTYNWTNTTPEIGLPASGTGDIAAFKAVNTTNAPLTALITVTPFANGCNGKSESFTIVVNPVPDVTVPASFAICDNTATSLLEMKSNVAAATFKWENDNTNIGLAAGGTGNIASFKATNVSAAAIAGTISVVPEAYKCEGVAKQFSITVNPSTVILTQPQAVALCEGGNASFGVSAKGTNVAYQWQVDKSNGGAFTVIAGANSAVLNVTGVTASMNGYRYRCVVSGDCIKSVTSDIVGLTVYTAPVINEDPKGITLCEGRGTSFSVDAVGSGLTYQWQLDVGAGFADVVGETDYVLNVPMLVLSMNGYKYRCVVSGTCKSGIVSAAAVVVVNAAPVITKQPAGQTLCEGKNASFSVEAKGYKLYYQWLVDKNDGKGFVTVPGATAATLNITNVSATMNGYRYQCKVSGNCAPAVSSDPVVLHIPKPVVVMPADAKICNGATCSAINISSSIATASYQWVNNTPSIGLAAKGSGAQLPAFDAVNTSSKAITAEITISPMAEGCAGEATVYKIIVNPTPVMTGSLRSEICSGDKIVYDPKSNVDDASFTWRRPGAGISDLPVLGSGGIDEVLVNSSKAATTVNYTFTVTAAGCSNDQIVSVIVKPVPSVVVTGSSVLCEGERIDLSGTANLPGVSFSWSDAAGKVLGTNAAYSVAVAAPADGGAYFLTAVKEGCASSPESHSVHVKRLPVATITGNSSLCTGASLLLNAASDMGADSYKWTGPAGLSSTQAVINIADVMADNAGEYKLVVTKEGCVSLPASSMVEVNSYPKVTIQHSGSACDNASLLLTASSSLPDASYVWNWMGAKTTGSQLSIAAVTGSQITASVNVTKSGCSTEESITLPVKPSPVVAIQSVPDLCQNAAAVYLQAKETTGLPGAGVFSGPFISAAGKFEPGVSAGVYSFKYTYTTTDGCEASAITAVQVKPAPKVNAGPDKTMYEGMGTYLEGTVSGSYKQFSWTPLTSATGNEQMRPLVTPAQNTTYILSATNDYGCSASDEVEVTVLKFRVPTAFTPNGDGFNDKWNIPGLNKFPNARVEIFNRWGTRLYLSKGYSEPWDGKYNGSLVPTGTYYYVIYLNDGINMKPVGGWVEVMR